MAIYFSGFNGFDLQAIARDQYGPLANLWPLPARQHAYDWAAKLPGDDRKLGLDLHRYVRDRISPNLRVVQDSFSAWGWKMWDPYAWDFFIQPVVLVANDLVWQPAPIATARSNFRHNVGAVADWYQTQMGKSLRLLEPQVFASTRNVAQWQAIYEDQTNRWDLFDACQAELRTAYASRLNANIIYVVTQYCGDKPQADHDAAGGIMQAGQGQLAATSAFACCHRYAPGTPTPWDDTVMYAIAHELGHCLGLPHPEPSEPGYANSVMQWGKPVNAILLPSEKTRLARNPFFV